MSDTLLLIGSLSNDLFRTASLAQRGSTRAASRFLSEAKKWSSDLEFHSVPEYVAKMAKDISSRDSSDITLASAERYLMYGVLLQNFALHQLHLHQSKQH